MFSFSKRLFAYVFSLLFLGILESSRKSFSFDYLIIETYNRPRCKLCGEEIAAYGLSNKGDGKVYIYISRNDSDNLIMCKTCYEKNRNAEYMSLVGEFYPNFKPSDDLPKLLESQSFISKLPGTRLLMRFNGRCEKCTVCTGDVDKFVEKIWYRCSNYSNVHHVHEQCANKLLKNKNNEYICPVCQEDYELKLVDPYMQSSIGEKKAAITQFIRAAYFKEFLK